MNHAFESFRARRAAGNARILDTDHLATKRFFALDKQVYGDGALPASTKDQKAERWTMSFRCSGRSCWPGMAYMVGRCSMAQLINSGGEFHRSKMSPAQITGTVGQQERSRISANTRSIAASQLSSPTLATGGRRER